MSSVWQEVELQEIADFQNGYAFKGDEYVPCSSNGKEVLRMGYIQRGGGFKEDGKPVYAPLSSRGNERRYELDEGDIVIAMTDMKDRVAILGNCARIPSSNRFLLNQRVGKIRSKNNKVANQRFLYYYMNSPSHVHQLRSMANRGVQVNLTTASIIESLVLLPPIQHQEAIAHILGTLDDKIELNRKTNETLEAMAKALFKSWFVDFDPVRAKAEGRPTGLPAEISDLFPDSFEDSELGEIPSGWKCSPLAEQSIYLSRGVSPAYCEEAGVLVLNQKCIRDSRVSFEKARRHDTTKKQIIGREVRRFDALVNSTGVGTLGRVAIMPICPEEVVVDSHVTVVRGTNDQESFFISTTLLNRQVEIEALGEGSTGQTELSRVVLGSLPIIYPSSELISAYFDYTYIIQDKIEKNDQANVALATTRDALLPKLIYGELRIPDAEKLVGNI
jgi:type I restriction enzyme S subunit